MFSSRSLRLTALALGATLALVGCAPSSDPASDPVVNVGLVLEPTDLNIRQTSGVALDQVLIDNVYQGLVGLDPDGKIVDVLATEHTVSADGLTYTFTVRPDLHFHSGSAVTVEDIVWSIDQVRTDEALKDHALLSKVTGVTASGDDTVTITLSEPDSQLLWVLAGRAGLVLEQAATNDLSTTANGTGPYRVDTGAWKQGDSLSLTRNDDYWGEPAQVSEVVFSYITDPTASVNATIAGDLDVQTNVDANLSAQLETASGITLSEGKTTDKYTLAFNNQRAPLTDPRVREAIRSAIDHSAIIAAIGGAGVPQGGPIPQLDPGYEDLTGSPAFDPAHARDLLASAGVSNLNLSLTIPNHYGTTVSTVLVSQFKDVGINLTVKRVEFPVWLSEVYTDHNYDLSFVDHAEARDFSNWANPDYYFGYDNAQVQDLYARSLAATDAESAADLLAQAARLVAADNPADWLYTATVITAIRDGVTGFPTNSTTSRLNLGNLAVE